MEEEEPEQQAEPINTTAASLELIQQAREGNLEECRKLLQNGASVEEREEESGWTALMCASSEGHADVVNLLIEHSAVEAESAKNGENTSKTTPLHWASYKGHAPAVWALLRAGMSPTALDSEKNMAVHLAATGGHLLIIQTLLSQGVTVTSKNMYGNTAMQLTTCAECKELLRAAAGAANLGLFYLCSRTGEFTAEEDSVAAVVIDRVSAPHMRPVRYTKAYAQRIADAEEGLQLAIKAEDTAALESAIKEGENVGASAPLLDEANATLLRLQAQIELQAKVAQLSKLRPLSDRAQIKPLLQPLKTARERSANVELLESAERLVKAVDAEIALQEVTASCQALTMVEEQGGPPLATSGLATRAEVGIARLASSIAAAQSAEAFDEVVAVAEQLHRRLCGESDLRRALMEPKQCTTEEGVTRYEHLGGAVSESLLEALTLRNDQLDAAVEKCTTEGTVEAILVEAQKEQKTLKANLKQAVAEDEERKAKEAAAAAKAAKKKKGGGKKKK